jgi:hypothetical protein
MRKLESLNSHIPESNESDTNTPVFHARAVLVLVLLEQLSFPALLKTLNSAASDPEYPKLEMASICCGAPVQGNCSNDVGNDLTVLICVSQSHKCRQDQGL